jgi:hypothetical protein
MNNKWWDDNECIRTCVSLHEDKIGLWFERVSILNVLKENKSSLQERYWGGNVEDDLKVFHKFFTNKLKATLIKYNISGNSHYWYYAWESGYALFQYELSTSNNGNPGSISLQTSSEDDVDIVEELCEKFFKKRNNDEPGTVHILGETENGLRLFELGYAGVSFEKENYEEGVASSFDYVIEELESSAPSGRLTLLGGIPGSGKTYFLRGLVNQVKNAIFVFVPAQMVELLSNPSFIPTLLQTAEEEDGGTIILIIEDADSILITRGSDNMSSINALLNLTSGLLGDMIDIRVIATTNAKKLDIDEAIMRSGRLSQHISINDISEEKAQEIFIRLIGKEEKYEGKPRLSDIYKKAREYGWKPQSKKKRDRTKESKAIQRKYRKMLDW